MAKADTLKFSYANMRGNRIQNLGKPKLGTDALTFALPSFTTAERDDLELTEGLIILNTTLNKIQAYVSGSWVNLN
jgi:hypothetical protein